MLGGCNGTDIQYIIVWSFFKTTICYLCIILSKFKSPESGTLKTDELGKVKTIIFSILVTNLVYILIGPKRNRIRKNKLVFDP